MAALRWEKCLLLAQILLLYLKHLQQMQHALDMPERGACVKHILPCDLGLRRWTGYVSRNFTQSGHPQAVLHYLDLVLPAADTADRKACLH